MLLNRLTERRPNQIPADGCRASRAFGPTQKVVYLYRDAGNYKFWGEFHIVGELSLDDLKPHLLHGEYFIPERIGLPSLVPEVQNEDDHLLHEFSYIELTGTMPYLVAATEFVERVRLANTQGWFSGTF
jgi:hypothetical protein